MEFKKPTQPILFVLPSPESRRGWKKVPKLCRSQREMRVFDLSELVAEMQAELRLLLRNNIELTVNHAEASPVKADRPRMRELILHHVLDAQEALPHGGFLELAVGRTLIDNTYAGIHPDVSPGEYVMFTVRDGGVRESNGVMKGRSLSLSAAYDAINEIGGHVCIFIGRGETIVTIYLPCFILNPATPHLVKTR